MTSENVPYTFIYSNIQYVNFEESPPPRQPTPDVDRANKLLKLRWFLNYLTTKLQSLYEVHGFMTVNQNMVKLRGRLAFRQYLPLKLTKWGGKMRVMAESSADYITNLKSTQGMGGLRRRVLLTVLS